MNRSQRGCGQNRNRASRHTLLGFVVLDSGAVCGAPDKGTEYLLHTDPLHNTDDNLVIFRQLEPDAVRRVINPSYGSLIPAH